ncbi:hypothetical protein HHX47_DHR8000209 [Lentinula edodes]|nr:hypothetical protein HHX47_DHR8000209 [Lentinula edodes]
MEFFESFPDITNTELASHFLFAYATAYMPKAPSLALCAAALSTDCVFYEKLQDAHKTRDTEALKTLCIHFNRNAWRFHPQLAEMNKSIQEIYSKGRIMKIARGEWTRPIWTPNTATDENLETNFHIQNLQIPEGNNGEVPLVVLYKLGSFQRDPKLKAKLDQIFSPHANTHPDTIHLDSLSIHLVQEKPDSSMKGYVSTGAFISHGPWIHSFWEAKISRPL